MKSPARPLATTLVIFGITGDLSRRKLLPALAELAKNKHLPGDFKLIGLSRRVIKPDEIIGENAKALKPKLQILQMDMDSAEDYKKLKAALDGGRQTIFYFAVPPAAVLPIVNHLSKAGLNGAHSKLLLEKPFGFDLESAKRLVVETTRCFSEKQIYRIDHFMAKEMAQNIAVFLGSNALFRDVWNNQFIESIEITAAEKIGIEGRAGFYEATGALRDIVQSHLMNLAALVLMRPCTGIFEYSEIPSRRLAALKQLKPVDQAEVIRGQYKGYRREVDNPGSMVETYVSLKLCSNDPRWQGVPIRLTTGKNLDKKLTEIRVQFKQADASQANTLILRIQPEEGIEVDLWAKQPGYAHDLRRLPLKARYDEGSARLPAAYEQVLMDAMRGSQTLFASSDEVLETWRILQPVIDCWNMGKSELLIYQPGKSVSQVAALSYNKE